MKLRELVSSYETGKAVRKNGKLEFGWIKSSGLKADHIELEIEWVNGSITKETNFTVSTL